MEVSRDDALSIFPSPQPARGIYVGQGGKLFLTSDLWCIETLVHETLHSLSSFNTDIAMMRRLVNLYEGLTEFLTGFVLWKEYTECFTNCWPESSGRACSMTYGYYTKLWGAFFSFVPLEIGCALYFWDQRVQLGEQIERFHREIRESGYPRFRDVISTLSALDSSTSFRQECGKNFGKKKFNSAYSSFGPGQMSLVRTSPLALNEPPKADPSSVPQATYRTK